MLRYERGVWLMGASLLSFGSGMVAPATVVRGGFTYSAAAASQPAADWLLLQVRLKVGESVIASSAVQPDGSFTIRNDSNAAADLVYGGLGINGEVYLTTIPPHRADTLKVEFALPVSDAKAHGRVACPKCQRRDKVLPIGGQAGVLTVSVNAKGDTTRLPFDRKYYHPDSDVTGWLDPHWYCVRDAITF
jgi:hypothetical protein